MKKKKTELSNEKETMMSLNKEIFDDIYFQELEQRLETDPLLLSSMFNTSHDVSNLDSGFCDPICSEFTCLIY